MNIGTHVVEKCKHLLVQKRFVLQCLVQRPQRCDGVVEVGVHFLNLDVPFLTLVLVSKKPLLSLAEYAKGWRPKGLAGDIGPVLERNDDEHEFGLVVARERQVALSELESQVLFRLLVETLFFKVNHAFRTDYDAAVQTSMLQTPVLDVRRAHMNAGLGIFQLDRHVCALEGRSAECNAWVLFIRGFAAKQRLSPDIFDKVDQTQ